MPELTASIPHQLSRDEVKRRLQSHIGQLRQQHGAMLTSVQETWSGDRLDFSVAAMAQTVKGHLTVEDKAVNLAVELPVFLSFLSGVIKQQIEQQGQRLLTGPTPAK